MRKLLTFLYGELIGVLEQNDSGRRSFQYVREAQLPFNLSLALPYRSTEYSPKLTAAFIEGLIPERREVREAFAQEFEISADNPFSLLEHIGLDCAGAVQFVRPEELEMFLAREGELIPYTDKQIGARLRRINASPQASWTMHRERWSLAGAQSKFALRWDNGWHEATGTEPTTHIFKPGIHDLKEQALNEHLCLKTLDKVGLKVASTEYTTFDAEPAIIIERYDRERIGNAVTRIHQEDLCQATSTLPRNKYESNKGPSALKVIETLRRARISESEVLKFIEGLISNYLIGAPDAHAKNYSILHHSDGHIELAPFYDIASGFPYETVSDDGLPGRNDELRKAAMAIGGERFFYRISRKHWTKFAHDARISEDWLLNTVAYLATAIPSALAQTIEEEPAAQHSDLPGRLIPTVTQHCENALTNLTS